MRFVICDDDPKFCSCLRSKIENIEGSEDVKISVYTNASEIIDDCISTDAFFLDIDMPDTNGFDVAKEIRKHSSKAKIIFVTIHDEMVYKSFEYAPFRFIR